MAKPYVFISYSRHDRGFVERLSAALRSAGVRTWTDVENISAGANWQAEIEKGLLQATVLLYVSSQNASTSKWMEQELGAFIRGSGRVIPIVIDSEGANLLPPLLRQIQWADFRFDFETALRLLLKGIHSIQGSAPIAAPQPISKGYVFISYAAEDASFAGELKTYLKKRGYSFWDFRESERDYQVHYTLELEGVITNAEATLSVISPDWKRSPTSLQELHFSKEVRTPIFLLRVRDPGPTLALAGMTFIDFTGSHKDGFVRLDGEMKRSGL